MLNIAMIAVLNRPHELKLHIKGALTNGVSKDEIREILMQVAIYAGVPAAVDSFRLRAKPSPNSTRNKNESRRCKTIRNTSWKSDSSASGRWASRWRAA